MLKFITKFVFLLFMLCIPLLGNAYDIRCTAYTPYECGGYMANGLWIQEGYVACDFLPLGTIIYLDGVQYEVGDRIGEGSTDHIDIVMNSYDEAIEFGVRYKDLQY